MKHDNYYSYLLSTLLEPSYHGMILFLCIAKLVFRDFHNLLECSKYALHISKGMVLAGRRRGPQVPEMSRWQRRAVEAAAAASQPTFLSFSPFWDFFISFQMSSCLVCFLFLFFSLKWISWTIQSLQSSFTIFGFFLEDLRKHFDR